jgi:predicted NAD/FAD-dependent oxidoreductase
MTLPRPAVVVVGAGISGVSCARVLADAGLPVVVLDRGRRPGGRMARWTRDGRAVDVGAAYLTVRDPDFGAVAESWATRGLAHPWTDSFTIWRDGRVEQEQDGPVRWAAEQGLRSLVDDLAHGLDVRSGVDVTAVGAGPTVDGQPVRAVVLAMPDPQARDLLGSDVAEVADGLAQRWQPVVTVVASYPSRTWTGLQGMFVHDSPLSLVVDDGRRRGDQAPVVVAHTTHEVAERYLDDPQAAVPAVQAELARLVGVREQPVWAEAKRWGSATPARPRVERYRLGEGLVGLCGDGWAQRPRVEGAWLSGRDLGRALVARLLG